MEPAYLSGDGRKIRPIPPATASSGEYLDFYGSYGQDHRQRGIDVEPPPDADEEETGEDT
jgi:hypothetical protein